MSDASRALFVGRMRYTLPLPDWLAPKWDAVERELDYRVVGAAAADSGPSDDRFHLSRPARPRMPRRAALLPPPALPPAPRDPGVRARRSSSHRILSSAPRPCSAGRSPAAARRWSSRSTATGRRSRGCTGRAGRRLVTPLADRIAESAVRRADSTRAVSTFTGGLIEEARGVPASARLHALQRPLGVRGAAARAAAGATDDHLRGGARALQEPRRAGRGMAAPRRPRPGSGARGGRLGLAARAGRPPRARLPGPRDPSRLARSRRRRRPRWTTRPCSCCRPGPKGSGA